MRMISWMAALRTWVACLPNACFRGQEAKFQILLPITHLDAVASMSFGIVNGVSDSQIELHLGV